MLKVEIRNWDLSPEQYKTLWVYNVDLVSRRCLQRKQWWLQCRQTNCNYSNHTQMKHATQMDSQLFHYNTRGLNSIPQTQKWATMSQGAIMSQGATMSQDATMSHRSEDYTLQGKHYNIVIHCKLLQQVTATKHQQDPEGVTLFKTYFYHLIYNPTKSYYRIWSTREVNIASRKNSYIRNYVFRIIKIT